MDEKLKCDQSNESFHQHLFVAQVIVLLNELVN